jgi:hypothetical protein
MKLSLAILAILGRPPSHISQVTLTLISPILIGYSPVYAMYFGLDSDIEEQGEEERLNRRSECYKLMLEAGADCSLENHMGDDIWLSSFCDAIDSRCSVRLGLLGWCLGSYANLVQTTLKHIISYGEPFINPRSMVMAQLFILLRKQFFFSNGVSISHAVFPMAIQFYTRFWNVIAFTRGFHGSNEDGI